MASVNGKVIWITGASSGIGEALAYALARRGARLILSARRKEELARVKGNCPPDSQANVAVLPLDLAAHETLPLTAEAAVQLFGHIDILVNNGGISQRGLVADTLLAVDRQIMEINYFGAIALTKSLLPHFIKRKCGHYVNVSSLTGKFGTPYRSGYAASKHALHGFFDALRAEHYGDNIKVTMVCPGFIQTPLTLSALTGDGSPLNKMDAKQYQGMPAEQFAEKMVSAIEREKQEVYIGGREVIAVYLKRFVPRIFSTVIRRVAVR